MKWLPNNFVRAFLPVIPLAFCDACGGGDAAESGTAGAAVAEISAVSTNAAPTIVVAQIAPAQIGALFDYLPLAGDPEKDELRFTAVNLPAWASLDPASGRISGTPGPADAGLYESISITVADATHQVATAPFSITVNSAMQSATGFASLKWESPPSKVSGEPLDDLAGYRILYGQTSSDLDHSILITNPATTNYQFSELTSGVWYFAVVAVNSSGLEGPPTTIASKAI
jgi:Putative Ig domain